MQQNPVQASFSSRTYNFNTLLGRSSFPDFTAKRVVVPSFQRDYSWEKSHVSAFWEDVSSFFRQSFQHPATDNYFLGPIVILPEQEQIKLLDGQQRLATATILFSVIRDIARARGGQPGSDLARDIQRDLIYVDDESQIYALELSQLDARFFESHVQEDPPSESERIRIRSHRLIRQAKRFLKSSVEQELQGNNSGDLVAYLKQLKNLVAERLKLVTIQVGSEEEAFLIFETLNDRGLRLSVPDLLLNHLMRSSENESTRRIVRNNWNNVIENLGQQKVSTFLRHMWVSRYGDVKSQGLYREIRTNLESNNIESLAFARLCAEESELYSAITNLDRTRLNDDALLYLEPLTKNLSADRALPLLLAGLSSLSREDFAKLAKATVSLVIRHSILANLNPYDLENALYSAARTIREEHDDGSNSSRCLQEAKSYLHAIDPSNEQIRTGVEDLFLTKQQAGYIIYALAEQVQSQHHAVDIRRNSIEHIYPENAEPIEWPNQDTLDPYVWHIGNLTVLEPSLNRSAGNLNFGSKKPIYERSDILMTNKLSEDYSEWGHQQIMERSRRLLPLIRQVWFLS